MLYNILCKVNAESKNEKRWNKQENNFRFYQKNNRENRRFSMRLRTVCGEKEDYFLQKCRRSCKYTNRNIRKRGEYQLHIPNGLVKRVLTLREKCGIINSG